MRLQSIFPFRRSVGAKLFILFFVTIVTLVVGLGAVSYSISKSIVKDKLAESTLQTVTQTGDKLESYMQDFQDLSMRVSLDTDVQEGIQKLASSSDVEISSKAREQVSTAMGHYFALNRSLQVMALYDPKGALITGSGASSFILQVGDQPWFAKTLEANGKAVWLDSKVGGLVNAKVPSFGLARVLRDSKTTEISAVLLFEIKLDSLSSQLALLKLGESAELYVVGGQKKAIYASDKKQIEQASPAYLEAAAEPSFFAQDAVGESRLVVQYPLKSNGWRLFGTVAEKELTDETAKIFTATWVTAIVALLIAAAIGVIAMRIISKPLQQVRQLMQEGAEGKLSVRANMRRRDEMGQLADGFNNMMEQITGLVRQSRQSAQAVLMTSGELHGASGKTSQSAQHIVKATEEIAAGASSLALEAEKGYSHTYDMGEHMKQMVEANDTMDRYAHEVLEAGEQGVSQMQSLIADTSVMENMIRSAVDKVEQLQGSAVSIRRIVLMLDNMMKQTNILSLNAAIEASRAGAAGKGFMVVADEIRNLADQSKQAIQEVGAVAEQIQSEIGDSVEALSKAYPFFQRQATSVQDAGVTFRHVQQHMERFIGQLAEVNRYVQSLNESQHILAASMSNVSAFAEQSSATTEEVVALSAEQSHVSDRLVQLSKELQDVSKSLEQSLAKFEI